MIQIIAIAALAVIGLGLLWANLHNIGAVGAGLASFFINYFYYIVGFLMFLIIGLSILSMFFRGKISKDACVKYIAVLLILGLFVIFGLPKLYGSFFDTYKAKLYISVCNPVGAPTEITSVYVDPSSFERVYIPFSIKNVKTGWLSDTVELHIAVKCYKNNILFYSNHDVDTVSVTEALCKNVEHWLYNLPAGSYCVVDTYLIGEEASASHKTTRFEVPV